MYLAGPPEVHPYAPGAGNFPEYENDDLILASRFIAAGRPTRCAHSQNCCSLGSRAASSAAVPQPSTFPP
jgi:hypothetical protein